MLLHLLSVVPGDEQHDHYLAWTYYYVLRILTTDR